MSSDSPNVTFRYISASDKIYVIDFKKTTCKGYIKTSVINKSYVKQTKSMSNKPSSIGHSSATFAQSTNLSQRICFSS